VKKPKVLVVYKESAYSALKASARLVRSLQRSGYWKVALKSHGLHQLTLKTVLRVLRAKGYEPIQVMRDKVHRLKGVDRKFRLVVTVGGDGTLLDTSHFVGKAPVLAVNSDPSRSVARFSGCKGEGFGRVLQGFLEGKLHPVPAARLEFSLNGRKGRWLVLNDLLVTAASPAGTSRYILRVGRRTEEQLSSGLWISSAAGSTAASLSAGGKALPATAKKFEYVVREAYHRKFGPRRLLKGILSLGSRLEVVSRMKEGRIFVDGANLSVPFRMGDRLKVRVAKEPLRLIGLRK